MWHTQTKKYLFMYVFIAYVSQFVNLDIEDKGNRSLSAKLEKCNVS